MKKNNPNENEQNKLVNENAPADEMIDINSCLTEELVSETTQNGGDEPLPNDYDDFITTDEQAEDEAQFAYADEGIQFANEVEMPKKSTKKNVVIAGVSAVCVVLVAVFCFLIFSGTMDSLFVTGGNEEMINAIPAEVENLTLEGVSDNYVLASGIFVNGQSIGKMKVSDARKLLEKYAKDNQPEFTYTIKLGENTYDIQSEGLELNANIDSVLATAAKYTKEKGDALPTDKNGEIQQIEYTLPFEITENEVLTEQLDKASEVLNTEPVNAEVVGFNPGADTDEKFTIEGGTDGQNLNYDSAVEEMNKLLWTQEETGEVEPKTDAVEPEITAEMATENMVPIATFSTNSTNTYNANHNMATALAACNGSIIKPGETWSFNDSTGNSNLESNGYVPATVIANGEYTSGVGGGLCQASSTIYNAALFANLEIVERYNHYWASPYVYSGFDATIDWGNLDLKLKNNTDYSVYLEAYMEGTTLTVTFYGWKDPSYDGIVTYSYNYEGPSGYYNTASFRIYIKDGEEIRREELPSSTYRLDGSHSVWDADSGTLGGIPGEPVRPYEVEKNPNDTGYWASGTDSVSSDTTEATEAPTSPPTTEKPTEPPTTEKPTEPPTTEAPTTEAPTTEAPTTEAPTTQPPASSETPSEAAA